MDVFGFSQQLVTTSIVALYQCPVRAAVDVSTIENVTADVQGPNVQTQITSIIVTNYSGATRTFSLYLTPSLSDSAVDLHKFVSDHQLLLDETLVLAPGIVMSADNTIWITCSDDDTSLTVLLNRIEVS